MPERLLHKRTNLHWRSCRYVLAAPGSGLGVGHWATRVRENQERKGTTKGAREQPSQSAGGQASGTTYRFLCSLRFAVHDCVKSRSDKGLEVRDASLLGDYINDQGAWRSSCQGYRGRLVCTPATVATKDRSVVQSQACLSGDRPVRESGPAGRCRVTDSLKIIES